MTREHDTRIWRIVEHHVNAARDQLDCSGNARMTFDRFHLAAKLSEAIDTVRRTEVTTRPELKHTRWLWLKNHATLSDKQQGQLHRLMRPSAQLATARALRWREDSRPSTTRTPATPPSTCDAGATAPNAPACNRSMISSPWSRSTRRHHRLAHQPPQQRPARRHQFPGPGRQSPRPRLPQQNKDDHYRLPHRSQTPPPHPHQPHTRLHDITLSNPLKTAKSLEERRASRRRVA